MRRKLLKPRVLGKRIRAARKAMSISQAQLSKLLGVEHSTVYRWEVGDSVPDGENLTRLIEALGVTYEQLTSSAAQPTTGEVAR